MTLERSVADWSTSAALPRTSQNNPERYRPAVIYCRVSSDRQAREGNGLTSQESACRRFAEAQGLEVIRVVADDFTGGGDFWNRPGITELLKFLDDQEESTAVVFDDLKRFARDTIFHLRLRQELRGRDAYPLCPNFRFEETPEGNFVETVIAATAELERKQNRRQVLSRMRARLEAGFWVFPPAVGYRFVTREGKKVLAPDPLTAESVRIALEGFASGRFPRLVDVHLFLDSRGCCSRLSRGSTYKLQGMADILKNPLYVGLCVCKAWGIRVQGQHEPLISFKTHERILERLKLLSKIKTRRDSSSAFPLRGHVSCPHCGWMITAGWSRGRAGGEYGYYRCIKHGCFNVRREKMEQAFVEKLAPASVPAEVLDLFEAVLLDRAKDRKQIARAQRDGQISERKKLEDELLSLSEALRVASSPTVRGIYEKRISEAETSLLKVSADRKSNARSPSQLQPLAKRGLRILNHPVECWKDGDLAERKLIQTLAFGHSLPYDRNSGFTTTNLTLLYRLLPQCGKEKSSLVELIGKYYNEIEEEIRRWNTVIGLYFPDPIATTFRG